MTTNDSQFPRPAFAATRQCVICRSALPLTATVTTVTCANALCVWQHQAMPIQQKCRICTRPLSAEQIAFGVCANAICREKWLATGPIATARRDYVELVAEAERRRDRAAARRGVPRAERSRLLVSMIPRNRARVSKLPRHRRDAFEALLRENIRQARDHIATGQPADTESALQEPVSLAPTQAIADAENALLGAGCAACRGHCCMGGGTHAFNRVQTMVRYLTANPEAADDAIVAQYLSFIGERTMTNGCIYQAKSGCTLPRELRSEVCNRFFCSGLKMVRNHFGADDPVSAFFIHRQGRHLSGGHFVQIAVRGRDEPT